MKSKSVEKFKKDLGLSEECKEEQATHDDLEAYAAIIRNIGGIYNNHNDKIVKVGGLVLLRKGVVAAWFGGGSTLNKVYYSNKDGRVHLSTWAVGGNLGSAAFAPNKEDIERYNKSLIIDSFSIDDFVEI